jgi:hypothetical protein
LLHNILLQQRSFLIHRRNILLQRGRNLVRLNLRSLQDPLFSRGNVDLVLKDKNYLLAVLRNRWAASYESQNRNHTAMWLRLFILMFKWMDKPGTYIQYL